MPTDEKRPFKQSDSYEVRNAVIPVFQKMLDGPERDAVMEMFHRFNDYIEFNSGGMPAPEDGTPHENRIVKLKATIMFFEAMSQNLHSLGLITNWNQTLQEMAKAMYERVREDRAKYWRTVGVIAEIFTVHMGGNGALLSFDALPDEIRLEVIKKLKSRGLLHDN